MKNYYFAIMMAGDISVEKRLTASFWVILISMISLFITVCGAFDLQTMSLKGFLSVIWIRQGDTAFILAFVGLGIIIPNLAYYGIRLIGDVKRRYVIFTCGVAGNLILLGIFKYYNFFVDNIEWAIRSFNFDPSRLHLRIVLTIGISFYTFKAISYITDVYRKESEPEREFKNFALFLAFFPSLLAGPIDRAKNLLSQFKSPQKHTMEGIYRGLHLIFYGLFKKVVIADGVARTVSSVFDSSGQPSWLDIVVATLFFTIQIYCDFSGYTDMARGTAKLFGINLMLNFNLPYFSKSPREFWQRWHISLSIWLRDYLYIPLGGKRFGNTKTYRNLMLTMVLGGLWHGAAWNFIIWGFYHGLALSVHRALVRVNGPERMRESGIIINGLKMICTIVIVGYGWLLFRAPSFDTIYKLSSTLFFHFGNIAFNAMRPKAAALLGIIVLGIIEITEYLFKGELFYEKLPMPAWTALYSLMIFGYLLGMGNEAGQFIYFNF